MTKVNLNLRIEEELKKRFSLTLKAKGETATEILIRAIEAYCNDVKTGNDTVKTGEDVKTSKDAVKTSNDVMSDGLETLIQAQIESYLESHPDREITSLWDSLDYLGSKIDKLATAEESAIDLPHTCEARFTTGDDVTTSKDTVKTSNDETTRDDITTSEDTVKTSKDVTLNSKDVTTGNDDVKTSKDAVTTPLLNENLEPLPEDTHQDKTPISTPEPLNKPKSEGSSIATEDESPINLPHTTEDESITTEDESPIAPTHNAEDESPIDLSVVSDKVADQSATLMDNDESPIDLSPVEVGERSIETGEETSNDNVTKDDNNEPEIAPEPKKLEPLLEITPPETTSEPIKTTHQDESLLKPPEPLEMAKIEESAIELLWMDQEEAINWFRLQTPPLSIIETSGSFPNSTIQETIRKNKITPTRKKGESYFLFDRLVIEFNQVKRHGAYQYRIVSGEPDRGITKSALSKILGVLPRTIKEKLEKGEANFQEWSEKKDPDGYAWRYSRITERFHRKS